MDEACYRSDNRRKHESRNPLKRPLVRRFHRDLLSMLAACPGGSLLDAGCGEGIVTRIVGDAFPRFDITGIDVEPQLLAQARQANPRAKFVQGSLSDLHFPDRAFDTVVCSEVLEHVPDPEAALRELVRVCAGMLVMSVPREPWFRVANVMGFSRWSTFGNPPDHINHWTARGFIRFLAPCVRSATVRTPFPWTMVLGIPDPHG